MLEIYTDDQLLTYREVANILKIHPETVGKYTRRKEMPLKAMYLYPEVKKQPRVKVSDLKEFLEALQDPRRDV